MQLRKIVNPISRGGRLISPYLLIPVFRVGLSVLKGAPDLTVAYVQSVMFVQRPEPDAGGVQLVSLQSDTSLLPQNHTQTRLILKAH